MQEHPVLDVLSATNHGGQAALFVCFVKLDILRIRSKNKVTCMTLKILVPQIVTTVNSLLFMLHPRIESGYIYIEAMHRLLVARRDIRYCSESVIQQIAKPDVSGYCHFWMYCQLQFLLRNERCPKPYTSFSKCLGIFARLLLYDFPRIQAGCDKCVSLNSKLFSLYHLKIRTSKNGDHGFLCSWENGDLGLAVLSQGPQNFRYGQPGTYFSETGQKICSSLKYLDLAIYHP